MNKFIGVSLTLLLVASMASAVVIESPAAHMTSMDQAVDLLTKDGFVSVAIVNSLGDLILVKTDTFGGSRAETKVIVGKIREGNYSKFISVVLNGVTYRLVKIGSDRLVAEVEGGKNGVVFKQTFLGRWIWIIGVYDENLNRLLAEEKILSIAS